MPQFAVETSLAVDIDTLSMEQLNMVGVNYELGPVLKMSTPKQWREKPLAQWPEGETVFCSVILLFGILPVDLHWIQFKSVSQEGFSETSSSLTNRVWIHERRLVRAQHSTVVTDEIVYENRLGVLGKLLLPIYKIVFAHRHKRLAQKFGKADRKGFS